MNAWKLYAGAKGDGSKVSSNQFFCELADQVFENKYVCTSLRQRETDSAFQGETMDFGNGNGTHLTPTTCKRKTASGEETPALYQSRYDVFNGTSKSKFICSACKFYFDKEVHLCHNQTGCDCIKKHAD